MIMSKLEIFRRAACVLSATLVFASAAQAEQRIVIKGSNTFGEELASALIDAYRKKNPDVSFELESKGSASGFQALLAGTCDIAASSRQPNEDEQRLARSRGVTINDDLIGYYGVAVIVNNANPIKALSDQQISDVFAGTITNWKQIGGEDGAIELYIRDPVSGTHLGFQELAMQRKPYAASAKMLTRYSEIIDAVRADRNGIGYSSMNLAEQNGIRAVDVNKVQPSAVAVNAGKYPFSRTLWLYTDKKRASTAAKEFIRFVRSRAGQRILEEHGFVRVFEERLWVPEM